MKEENPRLHGSPLPGGPVKMVSFTQNRGNSATLSASFLSRKKQQSQPFHETPKQTAGKFFHQKRKKTAWRSSWYLSTSAPHAAACFQVPIQRIQLLPTCERSHPIHRTSRQVRFSASRGGRHRAKIPRARPSNSTLECTRPHDAARSRSRPKRAPRPGGLPVSVPQDLSGSGLWTRCRVSRPLALHLLRSKRRRGPTPPPPAPFMLLPRSPRRNALR
jgi:hypothetical protein